MPTGLVLQRVGVRWALSGAAWAAGVTAVVAQIVYSMAEPAERVPLTALAVVAFAAASVADAAARGGARAAGALLVVAAGGGLLAEAIGVNTGVPFGEYAYLGGLGPRLFGVPVLVPLAWTMMAWPALLVARTLARGRGWLVVGPLGGWALAVWDVFLDPQMVDAGHWAWRHPEPSLPGVDGIPLTNFAGWLLVAGLIVTVLHRLVPDTAPGALAGRAAPGSGPATAAGLPAKRWLWLGPAPALYVWTYVSSVWAHLAFFGRPSVALVGGLVMGTVAVPYVVALVRAHR